MSGKTSLTGANVGTTGGARGATAIAMWDFSWLERRWPGAGYEDWGAALDELAERGYDAVRVDAYPHLGAVDPHREWELLPVWTQHAWGAPDRVRVRVQPALNEFVAACADRGIGVALSTWFRDDTTAARMRIARPRVLADVWARTLDALAVDDLLGNVLYVDLCNEYPIPLWTPFLYGRDDGEPASRTEPRMQRWVDESIAALRERRPGLDYCFSLCNEFASYEEQDVSSMDLLELHLWMVQPECSDFYARLDYDLGADRFDPVHYSRLAARGLDLYRADPEHWRQRLARHVERAADWSVHADRPLATTEGWAVVNYKDWPGLDWGWVKELCEHAVTTALGTGRWTILSTSNFCGPQFAGMWRDVAWHQRLTEAIRKPRDRG